MANVHPLSVLAFFTLLKVSFDEQKFLFVIRSYASIFSLGSLFVSYLRNLCLSQGHENILCYQL